MVLRFRMLAKLDGIDPLIPLFAEKVQKENIKQVRLNGMGDMRRPPSRRRRFLTKTDPCGVSVFSARDTVPVAWTPPHPVFLL
jgi:hypothetical protein